MILAVTGYKKSGKTTAANYIASKYGWSQYALATPLKLALGAMFGFTKEQLYGEEKDEIDYRYGITPRLMLQTLGTEWGQYTLQEHSQDFKVITGRDIWVKRFYYNVWRPGRNYVISDVRFQHEIEALREIDEVKSLMLTGGVDGDMHESESRNLLTDVVIDNTGTIMELFESLTILMEALGAPRDD
jgi:hypothetical protein